MSTPIKLPSKRTRPSSGTTSEPPHNQTQRLFTEEDELQLLNSFFKLSKSIKPTNNSQPIIDAPTLDHLETSLGLKFNHNQIIDKLRRLRLKYHKHARTKSLIKTPHDREVYEISRNIWGKGSTKRKESKGKGCEAGVEKKTGDVDATGGVLLVARKEFTVLESEISRVLPENGVWRKGFRCLEEKKLKGLNEKWMLLRVEEAEMKARRAELVQKQVKLVVDAFVSNSSAMVNRN